MASNKSSSESSFTFFRRDSARGTKRKRSESDSSPESNESIDSETAADESIRGREHAERTAQREAELDEPLPQHLRKFRPRGYTFNIPPCDRPVRIYADGVFDLFHLGHMKQLEQAKSAFASVTLVCGVPSDVETHKRKGLTVLTDVQRCETLSHCKWVDEVIPDAPWCVTPDFLIKHKIDYVAHDDLPYALSDSDDIYKPIKERGMFLTTQRTDGILTSDIITKIIRDYDKYLVRNFARGATRKELNVSWLKKNELEFKKHVADFRLYWRRNQENLNNVSRDLYCEVRDYMRGKKFDLQSLLDQTGQPCEDDRGRLPMMDFAAKYTGNSNARLNAPTLSRSLSRTELSLLKNVKGWISRDDESTHLTLPIAHIPRPQLDSTDVEVRLPKRRKRQA